MWFPTNFSLTLKWWRVPNISLVSSVHLRMENRWQEIIEFKPYNTGCAGKHVSSKRVGRISAMPLLNSTTTYGLSTSLLSFWMLVSQYLLRENEYYCLIKQTNKQKPCTILRQLLCGWRYLEALATILVDMRKVELRYRKRKARHSWKIKRRGGWRKLPWLLLW